MIQRVIYVCDAQVHVRSRSILTRPGDDNMQIENGKPANLNADWKTNSRWTGIKRPYTEKDVERLRGSIHVEHTLARLGSERLWNLLHSEPYINALGAMTGN